MKNNNTKFNFLAFLLLLAIFSNFSMADNSIERPFGYGKIYAGFQLGYGNGFALANSGNGDTKIVEYLATFPSLGVGISDTLAEDAWFRGNFEFVFEGESITNFRPRIGYSAGLGLLLRYNFLYGKNLIPFFEVGGGFGYIDFDLRDQADGLIYYPQAGLGLHYFLTDKTALNVGWRLHHMSNSKHKQPNNGINASLVLVGLTYHFD